MEAFVPIESFAPPPTTKGQLVEEAKKLGMLAKLNQKLTPRQSLLNSIYESFSRKRAIGCISILVFGSTGVGKSSTVNFLFDLKEGDFNAAKTNENTSQTRSVTELIIQTTEEEYETRDIKVAIVDSPGLNDSSGDAQDVCNAFSIRKFYEDYADKAEAGKIYPNLIFVVIAASDRRIEGPASDLVKSLRVLGKLDLVDIAKPNVVGIITHACQFARVKDEWIQKFEEKKKKLQSIILEYLHVEAPVVTLENYPEQEELDPEGYGFLLPDGVTQQPRNLFTACSNLLWENGDLFGHIAFTSAFKRGQCVPLLGRVLPAKIANSTPLDDSEKQLLHFIQRCAEGEIAGDPLLHLANKFISEQTQISGSEKSRLLRLAANLKRNGIQDPDELSELTTNSVYLTTAVINSPAIENFLVQWGVKPTDPLTLDDSVILIGHGFNLLMDKATTPSIFQYDLRNTKMGVIVPGPSEFSRINQTVTFMHNFENEVELMKTRQRHLNVSLEVNQVLFESFNARAGFSLNKQSGNFNCNTEYSFLLEQRMFRMSFLSLKSLSLTDEFKDAAKELPAAFESANAENRSIYKKFFDKWGHFVITQAFGGGSVELKISCSSSSNVDFEDIKRKLLASFNAGFMSPTASTGYEKSLSSESRSILGRCRIEWNGGDSQFHRHETMADPQLMNKWRLSLAENPAMLTTDLSLAPISELVEKVDAAKGKECYMALEDFLGGKFNLCKEEEEQQHLEAMIPLSQSTNHIFHEIEMQAKPIEKSVLGTQVELGSLYDAINGIFFNGSRLWELEDIEKKQRTISTPSTKLKLSSSLEETRENFGIDAEERLALSFRMFEVSGSAKFLKEKATQDQEARVDITCVKINQTRSIPMGTMVNLKFDKLVFQKCPNVTHFVSEVTEGAFGNISLIKKCSGSKEAKEIAGSLSGSLKDLFFSVEGDVRLKLDIEEKFKKENFQINVEGAIDEPIGTFEEAVKVGKDLPKTLKTLSNTLTVKLLPISILDPKAGKVVRSLDESVIEDVSSTFKAAKLTVTSLLELESLAHMTFFSNLKKQSENFRNQFEKCFTDFQKSIRKLLPQLKMSSNEDGPIMIELNEAVDLMKKQCIIGNKFVAKKLRESETILATFQSLESIGFKKSFKDTNDAGKSLISQSSSIKLVLNFFGEGLGDIPHPMKKMLLTISQNENESEDEESIEWFEDDEKVMHLQQSVSEMQELKKNNDLRGYRDIEYCFASISKAMPANKKGKPLKTRVGDVIMIDAGRNYTVTGSLPRPPCDIKLNVCKQVLTVSWQLDANSVLPYTSLLIRWRPKGNQALDSFDKVLGDDEVWDDETLESNCLEFVIIEYLKGRLNSDTDFEVEIASQNQVGFSTFSTPVKARTEKKPSIASSSINFSKFSTPVAARTEKKSSIASSLINFYMENRIALCGTHTKGFSGSKTQPWETVGGKKPWELTNDTLFLGFQTVSVRKCSTKDYKNEIAVFIVDVVPEYAPEIPAAKPDDESARMIMFVGETGSGKTTQINAFVSFLFGGDLTDSHRILLVDDRNLDQSKSITRYITVYRIRPLSDSFCKNTFYIIDTPGYGDTESLHTGFDRDKFITASMGVMFNSLPKMNMIVLTSKSGLTRATVGITAVVTNIFQLFAKNVRQCLRTILTFSDVGKSPAIPVLKSLDWPLRPGTLVEVNNSAFRIADADNNKDLKVRSWWKLSMEGQQEVARMLNSMEAVPTDKSAQVTHNRISLYDTCTIVEKQVLQTANETANLLRNLDAISNSIGAAPGEKVKVTNIRTRKIDVAEGKHTTLCINCNYTCHEVCKESTSDLKRRCKVMNNDHCKICPGKCHWTKHKNARFIIVSMEVTEYVVPDDLIRKWNNTTNSLEGAAIDAMNKYIELQNTLKRHIDTLVEITEKLKNESLKHNPSALLNYFKTLVKTATARGASPEQIEALTGAQNAMMVQENVARGNSAGFNESQILSQVVEEVRRELERRSRLSHMERAAEEERPCNLYNSLLQKLPHTLQIQAPPKLKEPKKSKFGDKEGALFPENLKAIVQLLKVILKTGSVTAVRSEYVSN